MIPDCYCCIFEGKCWGGGTPLPILFSYIFLEEKSLEKRRRCYSDSRRICPSAFSERGYGDPRRRRCGDSRRIQDGDENSDVVVLADGDISMIADGDVVAIPHGDVAAIPTNDVAAVPTNDVAVIPN